MAQRARLSCSRCFRTAIEQTKGKEVQALQNLSMLLRQKRGTSEERHAHVKESLVVAKDVSTVPVTAAASGVVHFTGASVSRV